jgi:serine/threonine-protein kinase
LPDLFSRLQDALADRYRLERELGQGGMATVYLAHDLKHDRDVALKVLDRHVAALVGAERFLREIRIVAGLQHPHIVPVFDSGELPAVGAEPAVPYFVMPFVSGESLRTRLARDRQLPREDVVRVTREVADALTYANARRITHRDVKPDNILLADGHALLADFGVAQALEVGSDSRLTQSGLILGTPAYMSPEQSLGAQDLHAPTDVYGLGAVAYEMLTGALPYPGASLAAIRVRQHSGPPRPASELRPDLSTGVDRVLARALAVDPADRFGTATEFAVALEATMARREHQSRRRPTVYLALALLLLGLAAGMLWFRPRGPALLPGVAVFPFRPMSQAAGEWVETLPDLLATTIEGTPGFRVVDPWSLWSRLRTTQSAQARSPDPAEADRLAILAHAGWFVLGTVGSGGGSVQLILRVYQVGRSEQVRTITVEGSADSLGGTVARAATGVIGALWQGRGRPGAREQEEFTTRSAGALKAYLQAKEAMRRGQVDSADGAITESLRQDSTFGLALLEATRIRSWVSYMRGRPYSGLIGLLEQAQHFADPLSERNRLRIEATRASIYTEGRRGVDALRRILEIDSTDLEAWEKLTYNRLVYGWQYGADAVDAMDAADHALALDPTYAPVLAMRAAMAARRGDPGDIARQEKRLLAADTGNSLIRGSLLSLRAVRDLGDSTAPWVELAAREPLPVWVAMLRGLRAEQPAAAERLVEATRRARNVQLSPEVLGGAELQLWLATGRFRAVERGLDRALGDQPALRQRIQLALAIASLTGVTDTAVARRAVRALEQTVSHDSLVGLAGGQPAATIGWAIAAWYAAYGDTAVTRRWYGALARMPANSENPAAIDALRTDLEARLAGRRGDIPGSLALARRAYNLSLFHQNLGLELSPEAATRFLLAVRLRQSGRSDSAAALFSSLVPPRTWAASYTPRAFLELGELAEERGETEAAAEYFGNAAVFWERGETEVASWRERARAGLMRVSGERTGASPPQP